jgi:DNA-binding response OmpR family regulator
MDDFLTKPLDAAALRAAVARWTGRVERGQTGELTPR